MSLDQAMKKLKFDSRLVEQNLATGQMTKEEYEAHLQSLPDSSAQALKVNLEDDADDNLNGQAH